MLASYRRHADWFEVRPDAAVDAICAVAHHRGIRMLEVTAERAEQIRLVALMEDQRAPRSWNKRFVDFVWRGAWTAIKVAWSG